MKTKALSIILALFAVLFLSQALYTVRQTEQAILTQFGRPVGDPVTEPGLHFKMPFVQQVNRIDLYREAAERSGTPLPAATLRTSTLMDGRVWDGSDPLAFAQDLAPA